MLFRSINIGVQNAVNIACDAWPADLSILNVVGLLIFIGINADILGVFRADVSMLQCSLTYALSAEITRIIHEI